jgi:hypothetical protein
MGSYAEIWLGSLYVGSTKNDFDPALMQLFRATDKRKHQASAKDLPFQMRRWAESLDDGEENAEAVYYVAPIEIIRDRLELSGYTLETSKAAFTKCMRAKLEQYLEYAANEDEDIYKPIIAVLKNLEVDEWLLTLRHIRDAGLSEPQSRDGQTEGTLVDYMLRNDWYGYSSVDLNVPLRLAIETFTEDQSMVYDLTDLTLGGYYSVDDDFVSIASGWAAAEHSSTSKTIVLTEGRSDGWMISESMKVLYPHLSDYFTFMDFELARVEGGAGALAGLVKSFAGAGIVNKVLAIFDNDTAGESAMKTLSKVPLPANIRIMRLPDLDALREYPTIGPSGTTKMNVNGMAASIELYLGADVLTEDGGLHPVQWTGYDAGCRKYQGEVSAKNKIHEQFRQKLQSCRDTLASSGNPDSWDGMREVLKSIFSAFHAHDRDIIFSELKEQYDRY